MAISEKQIEQLISSDSMKEVVENPSTLDHIKAEFEKSFGMVKDKLGDSWQDIRAIYDMIMDKDFQVKKEIKYVSIGALAYLISPIDLIPERIFGPLGLVDDVAVLLWALNYAKPEIQRYAEFKQAKDVFLADAEQARDTEDGWLAEALQTDAEEA